MRTMSSDHYVSAHPGCCTECGEVTHHRSISAWWAMWTSPGKVTKEMWVDYSNFTRKGKEGMHSHCFRHGTELQKVKGGGCPGVCTEGTELILHFTVTDQRTWGANVQSPLQTEQECLTLSNNQSAIPLIIRALFITELCQLWRHKGSQGDFFSLSCFINEGITVPTYRDDRVFIQKNHMNTLTYSMCSLNVSHCLLLE